MLNYIKNQINDTTTIPNLAKMLDIKYYFIPIIKKRNTILIAKYQSNFIACIFFK